jgi:hypothetical protein
MSGELARPTGVGRASTAYRMPIEGRDEWIAAVERLAERPAPARRPLAARHAAPNGGLTAAAMASLSRAWLRNVVMTPRGYADRGR